MRMRALAKSDSRGARAGRREVESRIRSRRATIGLCIAELTTHAGAHLTSPAALLAAGLLGAAVNRSPQPGHLKVMAVLQAAQAGIHLFQTATGATSRPTPMPSPHPTSGSSSA